MESILTMGTSSILGETEEWEKAERKMLQQITSTRAKSLAYFEAKKGRKGKSGRNVIVTLKSALNIILAICFMQRQSRWRKELLKANEDCENKYESSRRRRKANEARSVRILMKLPKQDPLSWITTIKPSKLEVIIKQFKGIVVNIRTFGYTGCSGKIVFFPNSL